jgi:aspartate/methionine/tyrosine aminotransferase
MQLAALTEELAPFLAMEIMERGAELSALGHDVVQLAVGEPDCRPPPAVIEATVKALERGETRYTSSRGLRELCEAIAAESSERRKHAVHPDQVIVTSGTSPALYMALRILLEPGDEVLIPTPHYPCYPNMVLACGGRPVLIPTRAEEGFAIDPERVARAITTRTRCIFIASPANPTGAVQPRAVVEALAALGLPILSDEIYDGLLFDGAQVVSPLGLADDVFVFDGFSKRYAMTGYRLGYMIAPRGAMRALQSLQQNLHISASMFVQRAGIAALEHGASYVHAMREEYAARRAVLLDGVRGLGLEVAFEPQGAFYVLADARRLGPSSLEVARALLERAHVALAPGRDFGEAAEGYLRFSYATNVERIREGLRRLERVLPRAG